MYSTGLIQKIELPVEKFLRELDQVQFNKGFLKVARDSLGRTECASFFLSKPIVYGTRI